MTDRHRLGDLQLVIMRVLWARGEATSAAVHAALLPERWLAPTTIATMLRKMEAKGVVAHRQEGRQFVYRATVAEGEVSRTMVGDLVERLFAGDPLELVHHLVREGELDLEELEDLRRQVEGKGGRRDS